MSSIRIEVLTPPTPYQTYLEERLQSARGLGWAMSDASPASAQSGPRHHASRRHEAVPAVELAPAVVGKPA